MKDFELLVSLNVFNESLMNDAVYKFKRYEDASLSYTGIDRHAGEKVGLYSTTVSREDYDAMAGLLSASMEAVSQDAAQESGPRTEKPVRPAVDSANRRLESSAAPKVQSPTYRPAYTPPAPSALAKKLPAQVDVSGVKPGTSVKHRAFGDGVVKEISRGIITVSFAEGEKRFQFPGAFQQGFLG